MALPRSGKNTQTKPAAPPKEAETPKQELVNVKQGAVATAAPDFMKGMAGQGVENVGSQDIETPRLKLLQAVSPELETYDEAKQGMFWHTVADQALAAPLRIVPIYVDIRAILWKPRWDGGGILARADDGINWVPPNASFEVHANKGDKKTVTWTTKPTVAESGLLDWGSSNPEDPNSQPAATRMQTIVVALPDYPELGVAVLTLQRSGIRVGKKFLGKLKLMGVPSFGTYFNMGAVKEGDGQESYYNYSFSAAGFVSSAEEFAQYKALYEQFKEMGLQIKDLENADEAIHGEASSAEPVGKGKATY